MRHGVGDTFKIQCANSGRVLGVLGASTGQGAQAVLWDDNGTNDHLWRFI
ncbi:RICIN domain-containing protein [Streptomyces sp. NBC_01443]|nr:RICIN domain-containing protein [Streptomyces sp. NBC_01443]